MDNPKRKRTGFDGQKQAKEALLEGDIVSSVNSSQLRLAQTLQAVGALLTFQLSLDEVLENILNFLGNVVSYDSASIQLFDEDGLLSIAAGRGFKDFDNICKAVRAMSPRLQEGWSDPKLKVISDTRAVNNWLIVPGTEYIRSWVGAPLFVKGSFIGVLNVDSATPNAYGLITGNTVMAFANQAAVAIENARLFEAERLARAQAEALRDAAKKRAAELEAVRLASLSLTASLDLHQVADTILKTTLDLLPEAYNGRIFLYDSEGSQRLTFGAALWAPGLKSLPWQEPRPNGLSYAVVQKGETIVIPDMRNHPLFVNSPLDWGGAVVGMPLKIGQRLVGVMNIAFQKPRDFTESELHILRLLGDQAAIAIENARLFEQAATERRHLKLLFDIGRELGSSLDPDEILNHAVSLTCQALKGLAGAAFLYQPDENRVRLRAVHGWENFQRAELAQMLDLTPGKGLEGWVIQHCQAVNVVDVRSDPRWIFFPGIDEEVHSAISSPILAGDRLVGVLTVLHTQVGAFTQNHMVLMQAICQQVGLALSNASRYQQVEHLASLLAAEQERLENLVEHLPVGVLLLDAENRLLVANPVGRSMLSALDAKIVDGVLTHLGDYRLEVVRSHSTDLLPVEMIREATPRRSFEAQARWVGGIVHRLEDQSNPYIQSGDHQNQQWVLMLREVTQERNYQARIQMQERLATVGQLAAGIAHDFNNIMSAILVYSDLLLRDTNLSRASRERLAIIEQQVERAASLIRQILDFSRRSVMELSPLDLLPFIKELDKMLGRVLPETIRLELNYQPGVYRVNADPTRLQQVFVNLALNARDAMPEGGVLRFGISRVKLAPDKPPPVPDLPAGEWIWVSISDTGMGIPAETLPHIFEPFFTTKPIGQGTGLGLAQVYGIIKQHEAYIDVHTEVGRGTAFNIYMPALEIKKERALDSGVSEPADGKGETVLLVEDDQTTLNALQSLLEAQNYRVRTAKNGIDALKQFEAAHGEIALVVSDVVMPQMGGVALYNAIQERWPGVKMLFITGHPLDGESQSLLEKGGVHWLQKPFSMQELGRALKNLASHPAGSEASHTLDGSRYAQAPGRPKSGGRV